MAGKKTLTRVAGVSLAVALTSAVVPVAQAQESSVTPPSSPAAASSSASVTPSSVAPVVTTTTGLTDQERTAKTTAGASGTGTIDATYASNGWTYTALARNPKNGRVYAISTAANDKPAGHLLRISPKDGVLTDLGAIENTDIAKATSAAFTADGKLVLIDDTSVYVQDLSEDVAGTGTVKPEFKTAKLNISGADRAGTPGAWTSTTEQGAADLISLSVNAKGEPFLWTLDTSNGKVGVEAIEAADGVNLKGLGDLQYAYTQNNGQTAFSDSDGLAVQLRGNKVVAVDTTRDAFDNYASIAGLLAQTYYRPVTVTDTPTAVAPSPSPSSPTVSSSPLVSASQSTEPTPSPSPKISTSTETTTTTKTTDAKPSALWTLDVEVRTEDDKAVEGAEFKLTSGGTVIGGTRADGTGNIQIQLKDAPAAGQRFELTLVEPPVGYVNRKAAITPETEKVTFVLPRDPNVTTTNLPRKILAGIDEARPIVTSALAPLAAAAAIGNAKPGTKTTTRTTSTTSLSAAKMTGVSTGRSTSASTTARVASRNSTAAARIVADGTSTSAVIVEERDDEELADTGTPMRAIIALGLLSLLVGAAYVALGRRREA